MKVKKVIEKLYRSIITLLTHTHTHHTFVLKV